MKGRASAAVMSLLTASAVLIGGTACEAPHTGDKKGARSTAQEFLTDVEHGDGQRACDLAVPDAASGLESGDSKCSEEILKLGLKGGTPGHTELWGDRALVRVGDDTVFLARWGSGWRVTAAGCTERSGRPYECEVEA
jgi:hypothetical protein